MWASQVYVRRRFGDEGEGSGRGHGGMGWEAGLVLWRRLGEILLLDVMVYM